VLRTLWSRGEPGYPSHALCRQWRSHADLHRRALIRPALLLVTCVMLWLTGDYFPRCSPRARRKRLLVAAAVVPALAQPAAASISASAKRRRPLAPTQIGSDLCRLYRVVRAGSVGLHRHRPARATRRRHRAAGRGGLRRGGVRAPSYGQADDLQAVVAPFFLAPFVLASGPSIPELRALVYAYAVTWLWACVSGATTAKNTNRKCDSSTRYWKARPTMIASPVPMRCAGLPDRREYESVSATAWSRRHP